MRRAREAYDTADYNIFINTGRHMTAEEHASLTELDIAFARPHEASAEALERREWARRAATSGSRRSTTRRSGGSTRGGDER